MGKLNPNTSSKANVTSIQVTPKVQEEVKETPPAQVRPATGGQPVAS
jgi:hypothetical protein